MKMYSNAQLIFAAAVVVITSVLVLPGCAKSSSNPGIGGGIAGISGAGGTQQAQAGASGGTGGNAGAGGGNAAAGGSNAGSGGVSGNSGAGAGGAVPSGGVSGNSGAGAGGTVASGGASGNSGAGAGGTVPSGGTGGGTPIVGSGNCQGSTIASITGDYSANGPLQTTVVNNTGPSGQYTIYRPTTLGENGNKHPIATWGNGITTNPSYYPGLLGGVASHGFVVIASNSTNVTGALMTSGLDWMVAQNDAAGDYQGKLNTTCLVTFGYSLGGGASVDAGSHQNVVATASMHGVQGAANALHAPLLLLTSETDTFVVPATFVTPTYQRSSVQTFYGTLSAAGDPSNLGHLIPVDGGLSLITAPQANLTERAAVIAWLRYWVYDDQGAKHYFYGDDCVLCVAPWTNPQRKNWQ